MDILTSLHGKKVGLGSEKNSGSQKGKAELIVPGGFLAGDHGSQSSMHSLGRVVLFDDFFGDVLAQPWDSEVGTDAQVVAPATSAAVGGMIRMTAGDDAAASMAANGVQLHSELNWYANKTNLVMDARVKLSAITSVSVFVGFTDQVSALEMPIHSAASANTITTNATDAVGLFFDTSMTDDSWWAAGVKADTDATHATTSTAPVAGTYQRLRIEADSSGNAIMYIDGVRKASVTNAVTATVGLTPVIAVFSRTTATRSVDVDYIYLAQDR